MKEPRYQAAALADYINRYGEVPPPDPQGFLDEALRLNQQRQGQGLLNIAPPPKQGWMLGPASLGLDVPLADVISPMGAAMVDRVFGENGLGYLLPGTGDLMDARDAIELGGQAIGAGLEGDWGRMGGAAGLAAIAAMGALPAVDAPNVRALDNAMQPSGDDFLRPVALSDTDTIAEIMRGAGAKMERGQVSRSWSDRFGPSLSEYWRVLAPDGGAKKVRFSDHDNGLGSDLDIRYGETNAASAVAMLSEAAGVPAPRALTELYGRLGKLGQDVAAAGYEVTENGVRYTDPLGRSHSLDGAAIARVYVPGSGWQRFIAPDGGVSGADKWLAAAAAKRAALDAAAEKTAAGLLADPARLGLSRLFSPDEALAVVDSLLGLARRREFTDAIRDAPKDRWRFLSLARRAGAPFDKWRSQSDAAGELLAAFRRITQME